MKNFPLSIFPMRMLQSLSRPLIPFAARFDKVFPNLELQLNQAQIDISKKEYVAMMIFTTLFYLVFFSVLLTSVFWRVDPKFAFLGITIGLVFGFFAMIQASLYPSIQTGKKEKEIERNLLFALRTMLIEIKSGVTLFDAMQLIANSNYGSLSSEFKKAVDEMNTGTLYDEALQKLGTENPSPYFRKAIWQIVNGMKAGGDIAAVLKETVSSATRDQRIAINKYAAQLRLMSLGYMMLGVILPALGMTFLIVIGMAAPALKIEEWIFWLIAAGVIVIQVVFMGVIKSARPTVME